MTRIPAASLRRGSHALLGDIAPAHVVHMCGAGVTARHNLLAMEVVGLARHTVRRVVERMDS